MAKITGEILTGNDVINTGIEILESLINCIYSNTSNSFELYCFKFCHILARILGEASMYANRESRYALRIMFSALSVSPFCSMILNS